MASRDLACARAPSLLSWVAIISAGADLVLSFHTALAPLAPQFLRPFGFAAILDYLEYLIGVVKSTSERYHTRLAMYYVEPVSRASCSPACDESVRASSRSVAHGPILHRAIACHRSSVV